MWYFIVVVIFFGNFLIAMRVMAKTVFGKPNEHVHYIDLNQKEIWMHLIMLAILLVLSVIGLKEVLSHRDLVGGLDEAHHPEWSPGLAVGVLLASTVGVALVSELLVGNIEAATQALGLSEFFVGIIVIPLVGNDAEHLAAVSFAVRNKMDLAVQIAVGSSLQIALLVAPILVVWGWAAGRPFDLVFHNPLEIAGLAASIVITNAVVRDGETHWLEGVMLLGVYALLGFAFFYTPR
jgi:Ca2+:H+ antiporter